MAPPPRAGRRHGAIREALQQVLLGDQQEASGWQQHRRVSPGLGG